MFWPPRPGTQASPHERHVGQSPDRRQLADRVDQDDRRRTRLRVAESDWRSTRLRRTTVSPCSAPASAPRRRIARRGGAPGSAASSGAAGGPRCTPPAPRLPRLPSCCRPRRPGRSRPGPAAPRSSRVFALFRSLSSPSYFTEPVTLTRWLGNAQLDESPRVFRILRGHDVDAAERRLERAAQAAIAAIAPRAETGVDDRHLGTRRAWPARIRLGQSSSSTRASTVGRIARDRPPGRPAKVERCVERDQVGIRSRGRPPGPSTSSSRSRPPSWAGDGPSRGPEGAAAGPRPRSPRGTRGRGVADPQRGLSHGASPPSPRDTCPLEAIGRRAERREDHQGGRVDQVEREWHLGESFPGTVLVTTASRSDRSNCRASTADACPRRSCQLRAIRSSLEIGRQPLRAVRLGIGGTSRCRDLEA